MKIRKTPLCALMLVFLLGVVHHSSILPWNPFNDIKDKFIEIKDKIENIFDKVKGNIGKVESKLGEVAGNAKDVIAQHSEKAVNNATKALKETGKFAQLEAEIKKEEAELGVLIAKKEAGKALDVVGLREAAQNVAKKISDRGIGVIKDGTVVLNSLANAVRLEHVSSEVRLDKIVSGTTPPLKARVGVLDKTIDLKVPPLDVTNPEKSLRKIADAIGQKVEEEAFKELSQ